MEMIKYESECINIDLRCSQSSDQSEHRYSCQSHIKLICILNCLNRNRYLLTQYTTVTQVKCLLVRNRSEEEEELLRNIRGTPPLFWQYRVLPCCSFVRSLSLSPIVWLTKSQLVVRCVPTRVCVRGIKRRRACTCPPTSPPQGLAFAHMDR